MIISATTQLLSIGKKTSLLLLPVIAILLAAQESGLAQKAESGKSPDQIALADDARAWEKRELSNLKQAAIACHLFAADHDGVLPTSTGDLTPYLGKEFDVSQIELVAIGKLTDFESPHTTVLLESKLVSKTKKRAVAFVDAHAELRSTDDMFQPLDTRTRCIVLFRECHVLIDQKDIDGIFEIVADGGPSGFKLYPDPDSLSPELKQERQDVDRFIERNFRSASLIHRSFYKLQYSDLTTAKEKVTVINTANDKKADAKLHLMKIKLKIPDKDRYETVELRFLQIAEDIYWVPIGW
jgi:hypothetical protein